jgi:hypothetical protein
MHVILGDSHIAHIAATDESLVGIGRYPYPVEKVDDLVIDDLGSAIGAADIIAVIRTVFDALAAPGPVAHTGRGVPGAHDAEIAHNHIGNVNNQNGEELRGTLAVGLTTTLAQSVVTPESTWQLPLPP